MVPPAPVTRTDLPGDEAPHRVAVEHRLGPAEQVFDGNRARFELVFEAGAQLRQPRQPRQAEAEGIRPLQQVAHRGAFDPVVGQHNALGPRVRPLDDPLQVVEAAQHGNAVDGAADAPPLVVDHADDLVAGVAVAPFLADEGLGGVVGANQQDGNAPMFAIASAGSRCADP